MSEGLRAWSWAKVSPTAPRGQAAAASDLWGHAPHPETRATCLALLAERGPAEEAAGLPVAEKSRGPLPFLDPGGCLRGKLRHQSALAGVVGGCWKAMLRIKCKVLRAPFALLFLEWKGTKPSRVQREPICGGDTAVWSVPALPWPAKPEMGITEACHGQPQQLQ